MPACDTPGMISTEESRYYVWVGRRYRGVGEAVELGSWLGRSTFFIVTGLSRNRRFASRRLHVFDDFVWRSSWMDAYLPGTERPADGSSFRPLFDRFTTGIADRLTVSRQAIVSDHANAGVPPLAWEGGAVELLYVDCGRTLDVNEAWFRVFSPFFVPGRTLIIMQDWQTYKEQPAQAYNQTKLFTDGKADALELLHELRQGQLATFLWRG
jgi:hypothetical protein